MRTFFVIYFIVGIAVIGGMVYYTIKHEHDCFYVRDIWKLILSWIGWPVIGVLWVYFWLDDKYQLSDKLADLGGKKLF